MRVVLALGVAMVLVVSGAGAAALTVNEAQWETQRIQAEAVEAATTAVTDARAAAVEARMQLVTSVAMARPLATGARELLDLAPGWATADDLVALRSAVEALEAALAGAKAAPIGDVDATMLDDAETWVASFASLGRSAASSASEVDARAAAVRVLIEALARSAVKGGSAISDLALAGEPSKDEARTQLAHVADTVRSGEDPLEALAAYTVAWASAHASQVAGEAAAAEAAAAEAAVGSSSSGSTGFPAGFTPLVNLVIPYLPNPWDDPCDYC